MPKPGLRKVERVRVFEQAVEQLRAAIFEGEFLPDSRLPTEQELAELLDVGRSTVREALRVLEAEGLIAVRRGAGAYVAAETSSKATRGSVLRWLAQREGTVLQILEVRESIEGLTAGLTALSASPETLRMLQRIVEEQLTLCKEPSPEGNVDQLAELDIRFHLTLSSASGNDIANEIVSHVVPAFSRANRAVLWVGGGIKETVCEHEHILRAVEARDPVKAEKLMREHVARVRHDLRKHLSEQGVDQATKDGAGR